MAYVPIVPHQEAEPPSPLARELAQKIAGVIEEYRRYYPNLTAREVEQALRAAGGDRAPQTRRPALAALGGVVAFAVGVALFVGRTAGGDAQTWALLPVIVAVAVAGLAAFVIRQRR